MASPRNTRRHRATTSAATCSGESLDVSIASIPQPLSSSMPLQRSHRIASQPHGSNPIRVVDFPPPLAPVTSRNLAVADRVPHTSDPAGRIATRSRIVQCRQAPAAIASRSPTEIALATHDPVIPDVEPVIVGAVIRARSLRGTRERAAVE
jgi:hypothetical protein